MLLSAVRSAVSSAVQSMIGTGLQPTFNLVFAGATALDQRVTFTRSTTTTRVNASGVIESVAIDTPRFDYDPVTLAPKGLLIEEQRTNLAVQSNAFTTTWLASDVTLTSGATVSPDGTANAWLLADTAANAFHNITQPIAWTAAAYTFSVYAKFNTHRWISARIGAAGNQFFGSWDLQNGVVGSATAGATVQMQNAGNGWYRLTLTATLSTAGNANLLIQLTNTDSTSLVSYTGTATGSWIYGAQLEAGAFATSYIPTTTAAATRAADVASVTGANFSSWYNQTEGTTLVETATLPNVTAAALTHAISDGTFNQSIYGNFNAGNLYIGANVLNSGVNQASGIGSFSITASTNTTKDAFAYKQNNFGESCNGATPKTDSTGTVPTVDRLYIGTNWAGAGNFLNGHIRSFKYYPTRLSNETLQSLTFAFASDSWLFNAPEQSGHLLTSGLL